MDGNGWDYVTVDVLEKIIVNELWLRVFHVKMFEPFLSVMHSCLKAENFEEKKIKQSKYYIAVCFSTSVPVPSPFKVDAVIAVAMPGSAVVEEPF